MARSALSSADCTIASCITSRASLGSGRRAFSSISRVSRSWSRLPQFTPMRTGLPLLRGDLDDLGELPVALVLEADIAGIDAVFGESFGASRILGEQRVAVIVEVADQRRVHAQDVEPLADVRHGRRGLGAVDGDAHELGAGARQRRDLGGRRLDIGRVGIGHRLDDDGRIAAERDGSRYGRYRGDDRWSVAHAGWRRARHDRAEAAAAVPYIASGCDILGLEDEPLIGDFHYNGHSLLKDMRACAAALGKSASIPAMSASRQARPAIRRDRRDRAAHGKPVRCGVNWGSLDQDLLARLKMGECGAPRAEGRARGDA